MDVGIRRALREHKRAGNPIVTWDYEHDRVVFIPPEEIDVPDEVDCEDATVPPGVTDFRSHGHALRLPARLRPAARAPGGRERFIRSPGRPAVCKTV